MYVTVCWLLPLAILVRLAFAVFVYLGLKCDVCDEFELATGKGGSFTGTLSSVQIIVIGSSAILAIPMLFFLGREAVILRSHPAARIPARRGAKSAEKVWHHEYLMKHSIFDGQGSIFQHVRGMSR